MATYLHWDTQWPAPDGFHVPTNTEWNAVYDAWVALWQWSDIDWDSFRIKMKMPFAGSRDSSTSNVYNQGSYGRYWASTAYSAGYAYNLYFRSASLSPQNWNTRAYGFSVRCFRNSPLQPSSSWTTIYAWSNGSWIYHNSTEWVISISSDWTNWITIADKNLWATTVYNDWDELSEANCGYYYQWWNNYGFPWTWTISKKSSTAIDASAYWPGNYYSSDTWITANPWDSSDNRNLWWWVTDLRPENLEFSYAWLFRYEESDTEYTNPLKPTQTITTAPAGYPDIAETVWSYLDRIASWWNTVSGYTFSKINIVNHHWDILKTVSESYIPTLEDFEDDGSISFLFQFKSIKRIIKKFYHMWVEYKIKGGKPTPPTPTYKTYTVTYTEASTPVFTYSDDATDMTAWSAEWDEIFGYYPCLLNTSWVETAKLNPNDYAKTIDWASANITSGDNVMVMFPRRGYKISKSWNTVTVSITTNPNAEWYCYDAFRRGSTQKDKFYLWAYHWSLSWSVLKSWSGKSIAVNHNITNWRTYAHANGTWYEQWAFNQLTYLQCLWLLKYKSLDSQTTLWQWYTWWSDATTTGTTNTNWLNYWSTSSATHVKLFWIEDFWWNTEDLIDGIYCDSSYNIWTWTDNFTSTAMTTNYTNQWSGWISGNIVWYMKAVQGTSTTWFIAKGEWWSKSTYYSDCGALCAGCFPGFGGHFATGTFAGVFYLDVRSSASEASYFVGSRLMFL